MSHCYWPTLETPRELTQAVGCVTRRPNLERISSGRSYPEDRHLPRILPRAPTWFPLLVERFPVPVTCSSSYPLPPSPLRAVTHPKRYTPLLLQTPAATFWNKTRQLRFPYGEIICMGRSSNPHPSTRAVTLPGLVERMLQVPGLLSMTRTKLSLDQWGTIYVSLFMDRKLWAHFFLLLLN